MSLSIIIPCLNEEDIQNTIDDIHKTIEISDFEIIVIDDNSDFVVKLDKISKLIRNKKRIGVDGCRQLGVELSSNDNILIIDSHMRFSKDWGKKIVKNIEQNEKTIWCFSCCELGCGNMDMDYVDSVYRGANIVINKGNDILEPKWRNSIKEGIYEVPCVLGGAYGLNKKWMNYIKGFEGLKMWGSSEVFISLKSWLAGGNCRIDTGIEIGHKFRDHAPYSTYCWNMIYNKLFILNTIFPSKIREEIIDKIPKTVNFKRALEELEMNKTLIKERKKYYEGIFVKDFYGICKKLSIEL